MRAPAETSPLGLVQERLSKSGGRLGYGWRVLVAAICLYRTPGGRADDVIDALLSRWPTPRALADGPAIDIVATVRPLGMQETRATALVAMSLAYDRGEWVDPSKLPGIGSYGLLCWRIFVERELPEEEPADRWLAPYWRWAMSRIGARGANGAKAKAGDRAGPDAVVGDAVITAAEALSFARLRTSRILMDAFWAGELGGRMLGGSNGWVTTYGAVLAWVRDEDGRARRKRGEGVEDEKRRVRGAGKRRR